MFDAIMGFLQSFLLLTIFLDGYFQADVSTIIKRLDNLEKKYHELSKKVEFNTEYCRLQPDNICSPCNCRDDDRLMKKYYCDCQHLQPKRDCLEFKQHGIKTSGIYKVHQNILKTIQVYCDQETDGGGWTVFQRRIDGSVSFFRDWLNYKNGFGQLQNEFWLGNENLFTMSLQGLYPRGNELRIDMENSKRIHQHAKYKKFQVGNADTHYTIQVGDFAGTASDELTHHSKMMFSTYDVDNDVHSSVNCAMSHFGAWWFKDCFTSHLNGLYYPAGKMSLWATGIHWGRQNDLRESLTFTEMKIRRRL